MKSQSHGGIGKGAKPRLFALLICGSVRIRIIYENGLCHIHHDDASEKGVAYHGKTRIVKKRKRRRRNG